ncbi:hemin uptake protein HemP [Sulfitobacter geojensis]|uniref:Hemin uptake protein HemP n=1 Tax=Sulfitobacter geojensis TaxID=1342299 RepID=A0AAE2W1K0_9RHOB|nr:hemP domain containing protein [Sulfitobacter geojensis]MBM1691302.1 hemin uptake protein HemP [Sulfitobacter geojensis]MBM1695375.1 hemin uptake protein HemP [Sulfitobacter geojensis]MBM1707475.1 hemin uptake protein HemP [Sulfitobacter geojensis]MBM1711618.1 hemin uptake protein HemP [Sulfitobacter geojensis]
MNMITPKPKAQDPLSHDARTLIGAGDQAKIVLDGVVYVLRITRAGKLILTK